jgi:hypothetical protein
MGTTSRNNMVIDTQSLYEYTHFFKTAIKKGVPMGSKPSPKTTE